MKEVLLTKGRRALVDDEDFEKVIGLKWHLSLSGNGMPYALNSKAGGMHRFLMGAIKGQYVDHVNGDGLDNQKDNLRICSLKENTRNKKHFKSRSGYKGVVWHEEGHKWQAQIMVDYKCKYLGLFEKKEEAAKAYNEAAKKYFGEFANLNPV